MDSGPVRLKAILITGASSGIGAAVATRYAAPGVHLSLWGRSASRLENVAAEARQRGATVSLVVADLTDVTERARLAEIEDDRQPFDVVILAAGLSSIIHSQERAEALGSVITMAAVNFSAPIVMATFFANVMVARGSGRIGLIGSSVAFFPLPHAPTYSASKAGLHVFSRALRLVVRQHGVSVTLISPGFVDTPMSRKLPYATPFLMSAEKAAKRITIAVDTGARHIIFPWPFVLLPLLAWLTPAWLGERLLKRLYARRK